MGGAGGGNKPAPYYLVNDGVLVTGYTTIIGAMYATYNNPGNQFIFSVNVTNTFVRFNLPPDLSKYSKLVIKRLGYTNNTTHVLGFSSNPNSPVWGPYVSTLTEINTELSLDVANYPYLIMGMTSNGFIGSIWLE